MSRYKVALRRIIYTTLWTLGLGTGFALPPQPASAQTQTEMTQTDLAELACREALDVNTIEALEEYLRRFPDADTACKALALDALNQFSTADDEDRGDSGTGGTDGGYGG